MYKIFCGAISAVVKLSATYTFNYIAFRAKFGLTSYEELPPALHKKQSLSAMYKTTLILVVKNVPMCHASGSKGSQPHNIQAYRLVLKSLQMKGHVKHQNMQMLVKLFPL